MATPIGRLELELELRNAKKDLDSTQFEAAKCVEWGRKSEQAKQIASHCGF